MYRSAPVLDSPPLERFGIPELVPAASPAAGADFSYAVTGAYYVRVVTAYCKLVTDANVANREVVASFEDAGGNRYALSGINTTVTASNTAYYAFNVFQPEAVATVDSSALVPLPALLLRPTDVFKLHVVNVQTTDQLSQVRLVVEKFYTHGQAPGRPGPEPGE